MQSILIFYFTIQSLYKNDPANKIFLDLTNTTPVPSGTK